MNQPYVKHFDENGKLLNPIKGRYESPSPNRRKRREIKNQPRFFNNRKTYPMVVADGNPPVRYKKVRQVEKDKDGDRKYIYHYLLQ